MINEERMVHELERFFGKDHLDAQEIFHEGVEAVLIDKSFIVRKDGKTFRSTKSRGYIEVKPRFKKNSGYYSTYFKGREMSTHRLVAWFFCDNYHGYPEVNHKDGDKSNNSADNLEWCNRSMNMRHAYAMGMHPRTGSRKAV